MSHYQEKSETQDPGNNQGKLLTVFQRKHLQKSLQGELSKSHLQRIQIMLLADQGKSPAQICQTLKCCPATAGRWIHIARSGMAHQWQECSIGRPKKVNDEYLERLKELVSGSPRNYGYSFQRWTAKYLSKHLAEEFGVELTEQHINRLLKQMGLSTRQKASNSKDTNNLNVTSNRIFINDIQSENIPDSLGFLSIGLINLGKH